MKKCLKMVPNFSEFLFYSHDCMLNILDNFCIITIGVELQKSTLFSIYHKQLIKFRGYSVIHINEMINLKSMRLIYLH